MIALLLILIVPFSHFGPVREVRTGYGVLVDDLESHVQPGHPMRNEDDLVNWVHELTHQVNSDLRNACNTGPVRYNCFYVFENRYLRLPEPAVTLRDVQNAVRPEERGDSYELYLVKQQRYWNREPLYVIDELTAYINGHLQDPSDRANCEEMLRYSMALVRAIRRHDPNYQHLQELIDFIQWNKARMK